MRVLFMEIIYLSVYCSCKGVFCQIYVLPKCVILIIPYKFKIETIFENTVAPCTPCMSYGTYQDRYLLKISLGHVETFLAIMQISFLIGTIILCIINSCREYANILYIFWLSILCSQTLLRKFVTVT
jgi:hypothetical protein